MRALVAIEPESSAAAASCQDETENNSNNDNTQDITEAFQCLDESGGEGRLTDEQVVTLFLGLGYQPIDIAIEDLKGRRRRSLDWEQRRVAAASIEHGGDGDWTLSQVCHVVSQFQRFASSETTRNLEWQSTFHDLLDADHKGYLTAADMYRLSQQCGCSRGSEGGLAFDAPNNRKNKRSRSTTAPTMPNDSGEPPNSCCITIEHAERMLAYIAVQSSNDHREIGTTVSAKEQSVHDSAATPSTAPATLSAPAFQKFMAAPLSFR